MLPLATVQVRTHAQKLFLRQQKESNGMMAPNGRTENLPDLPMPDPSVMGAPAGSDQLQALQEAGYQLQASGGGDVLNDDVDDVSGDAMGGGMGGGMGSGMGMPSRGGGGGGFAADRSYDFVEHDE